MIQYRGYGGPGPFVSFVPRECDSASNETDKAICGLNLVLDRSATGYRGSTQFDSVSQDHARMYVAVPEKPEGNTGWHANKTIECGLFNKSYEVEFSSGNGQLKTAIKKATRLNGVAGDDARTRSMCDGQSHRPSICYPDSISYIALLHALNMQLTGYLQQSPYGHISAHLTQVDKTIFMDTKELYRSQYFMNHGTNPDTVPADAMGITQALEEVFTNATLSLFSSASFL